MRSNKTTNIYFQQSKWNILINKKKTLIIIGKYNKH
jgi:hypothetical protein